MLKSNKDILSKEINDELNKHSNKNDDIEKSKAANKDIENIEPIKENNYIGIVNKEIIAEVVELWTGVPVNRIVEEEAER